METFAYGLCLKTTESTQTCPLHTHLSTSAEPRRVSAEPLSPSRVLLTRWTILQLLQPFHASFSLFLFISLRWPIWPRFIYLFIWSLLLYVCRSENSLVYDNCKIILKLVPDLLQLQSHVVRIWCLSDKIWLDWTTAELSPQADSVNSQPSTAAPVANLIQKGRPCNILWDLPT